MDNLYDKYRKKEKEMNEYATMHKLETNEIYASDEEKDTEYFESHKLDRCEMADFLYNNFTSLSSKDKRLYLTKCLSSIQVKRELLKFELKHYKQIPQSMTIKDFTKKAESIFRRYQGKAGGFYIEDTDWDLHDSTSDRYRVESNQIFFVNTADRQDAKDNETLIYIERIIKRLNCVATNIKVDYKFRESTSDSVGWIIIKCTDKSKSSKTPKITL